MILSWIGESLRWEHVTCVNESGNFGIRIYEFTYLCIQIIQESETHHYDMQIPPSRFYVYGSLIEVF